MEYIASIEHIGFSTVRDDENKYKTAMNLTNKYSYSAK
jgi:hypothetical protein